jgi:hypothetical protein
LIKIAAMEASATTQILVIIAIYLPNPADCLGPPVFICGQSELDLNFFWKFNSFYLLASIQKYRINANCCLFFISIWLCIQPDSALRPFVLILSSNFLSSLSNLNGRLQDVPPLGSPANALFKSQLFNRSFQLQLSIAAFNYSFQLQLSVTVFNYSFSIAAFQLLPFQIVVFKCSNQNAASHMVLPPAGSKG